MTSMRAVDLFAGCGGMSLGFQNAGFNIVGAFENWAPAVRLYEANFAHPVHARDINDSEVSVLLKELRPDLIIGGPPCQDFSIAGKREEGERANLSIRFAELVTDVKPEWVAFENVYNIERFDTIKQVKAMLMDSGYGITTKILDASRFGVPQKRRRYFLVARMGEQQGFLDHALESGMSQEPMTVRDYLGDSLGTQHYYMHPRSYQRRAVFSIDEPAATVRGINRPIPKGYKRHHGDTAAIGQGVRALTTKERSLLQTFPNSFLLPGAKSDVELAIGNAVPPRLAEHVANTIMGYVRELRQAA